MKMKSACNWTALAIGLSFLLANRAPAPVADTFTWVGGVDTKWANSNNWIRGASNIGTNTIPNEFSYVAFDGTASGYAVDLDSAQTAGAINFSGTTGYTLLGGVLDLYWVYGLSAEGSASYTVAPSIQIHSAQAWIISGSSRVVINHDVLSNGGGGGLTKSGTGTLLLNGLCDCGDVTVMAGTLGGQGTVQASVTIQNGCTVAPGNSAGKFTTSGSLTNSGTYHCEIDGATNDSLVVGGALDISSGAIDFDVLPGGVTQPVYVIASYGALNGTFATVSNLPPGFILDYTYFNGANSNNIALVPILPPLLHWTLGEGSGTNTTEAVSGQTNVAHLVGDTTWTNGIAPGSSHAVHFSNAGTGWIDAGTLTINGTYVAGMDPGYRSTGNQWTITAWVNLSNPQATTGRRELIGSATGVANWWNLGVQDWAGTQEALTFDFLNVPVHAAIGVPLGQPVFVAVVANNAGLGAVTNRHRFAIWNGTNWSFEEGSEFSTLGLALDIGTWREGVNKFDGNVDDVRIYDRALTQVELDDLVLFPPTLAIAPAGAGFNNISWTPATPGYFLQETANLSPANWTNSPSGATNPVVVPAPLPMKFYRLFKP